MFWWQKLRAHVARMHRADWAQSALLLLAFGIAADGFVRALSRFGRAFTWLDFEAYFISARMLLRGLDVYAPGASFTFAQTLGLPPPPSFLYPPYAMALFLPLATLGFREAGYVWMGLGVAALALAVIMLARALYLDKWKILALALIAALMPATMATLNVGQVSFLLTLFFVSAMVVAPRPTGGAKNFAVGVLLGIAAGMKVYPLLLGIPYALHRRFNALAVMSATFAATLGAGILFGGWRDAWAYWTEALPQAGALNLYPPNQSARAVMQRLFEPYAMNAVQNRQPVTIELIPFVNAPTVGNVLGWGLVVLILAVTLGVMWRRRRLLSERDAFLYNFALMVAALLMVIPLSWDHYEPHLLLPLAVVGLYKNAKSAPKILFALACLCLALHRFWNVWLFEIPYAGLMMFGFLGALCAWLALLWNPAAGD